MAKTKTETASAVETTPAKVGPLQVRIRNAETGRMVNISKKTWEAESEKGAKSAYAGWDLVQTAEQPTA